MSRRIPPIERIPRVLQHVLADVKETVQTDILFTSENVLTFTPAKLGLSLDNQKNVIRVNGLKGSFIVFEKAGNGVLTYCNNIETITEEETKTSVRVKR